MAVSHARAYGCTLLQQVGCLSKFRGRADTTKAITFAGQQESARIPHSGSNRSHRKTGHLLTHNQEMHKHGCELHIGNGIPRENRPITYQAADQLHSALRKVSPPGTQYRPFAIESVDPPTWPGSGVYRDATAGRHTLRARRWRHDTAFGAAGNCRRNRRHRFRDGALYRHALAR